MSGVKLKAVKASNGLLTHLKCSDDGELNVNVSTSTLSVNVDGLEALQTSGNNTLSSIDNKIILPSVLNSDQLKVNDSAVVAGLSQINNNVDEVEAKLDTINTTLTAGGVVDISTLSTHALQTTINSTLGDTNSKIDAMRGSSDLGTINTSLGGLTTINSTLGDTNSKIDAMRGSSDLGVINTSLGTLETSLTSMEGKQDTSITHLSEIEGAVETIEGCVGSNKVNVNISSGNISGFATQSTLANCETALNNISVNMYNGAQQVKALGSQDGTTTGTQKQMKVSSSGVLNVETKKTYSAETSIISSQAVAGSGTHTTASISNDANIVEYLVEHDFSGSDVSFEIFESIDNTNFFNVMGMPFNDPSDPSVANQGINNIQIKSPHFKIKFTNANGSSRNVSLSYVAITN